MGQVMRGLSSLVLIPIYTTHLAPAEFGLVELLTVVIDFASLLIGGRLGIALFKYYHDATSEEQKRKVVSTALVSASLANLAAIVLIAILSRGAAEWSSVPEGFDTALRVLSITLVLNAFNEVFFSYLRLKERPKAYVAANLLRFVGQLLLNILFIVYLGFGYWGIILAAVISSAILALLFACWLLPRIGITFSREYATSLFLFSFPLVISALGLYYVTLGNRYFLKLYQGLAAVGIYALAHKLGLTFTSLAWGPFATFWNTKQFEYARGPDAHRFFGTVFFYLNFVLIPAAVGVVVLTPHFLRIFATADYAPAIALVPWIVAAAIVQCWTDYLRFGIFHASRNRHLTYGTLISAVLVTLLYVWWIPREGALGAAKASFVALAVRLGYFAAVGCKFFPIDVPWGRFAVLSACFLAAHALLASWSLPDGIAMVVKGGIIVAIAIALAASPLTFPQHRALVTEWLARRRN